MYAYLLTQYYDGNQTGEPECSDIIGVYTTKDKAMKAAKHLEANGPLPPNYMGYLITEYEIDCSDGPIRDV